MTDVNVKLGPDGSSRPITLETCTSHKLILSFSVTLIRFFGPMFASERCFVLPTALRGIRDLRRIYAESIGGEVLVVGHTDATGDTEYNNALSAGRARSLASFLTDDVDGWLAFFGEQPPAGRSWGTEEIVQMLGVLPPGADPYFHTGVGAADAIEAFEVAHGMDPSSTVTDAFLRALITDYMGLDGTSLPPETKVVPRGCGKAFPLGQTRADDRRTEVFFFHGRIRPEPSGETSTAEYAEWLAAVTDERRLGIDNDAQEYLELRLHDEHRKPMSRAPFRVFIDKGAPVTGISGHDGLVFVKLPDFCPEFVTVQWGQHPVFDYAYELEIVPECSPGESTEQDVARLHNLGYAPFVDLEAAVRQFQIDYGVDDDPILGLEDGRLPPNTRARLDEIWDERELDAGI